MLVPSEHWEVMNHMPEGDELKTISGGSADVHAEALTHDVKPTELVPEMPEPQSAAGHPRSQFVYALGRVEPRFPSMAVEKEFAQAIGRSDATGLTDRQALESIVTQRENRYLARRLCWVFSIEGVDTYVLFPADPADLDLLVESVRTAPRATDIDVVVGMRRSLAPPEVCNGQVLPMVAFEQLYSFDIDSLVKSIPRPEKTTAKQFEPVAEELFSRVAQLADNAGATDEHRALNYLTVRYPAVYTTAADAYGRNLSLSAVDALPSRLSGPRSIVDVIFSYTNRQTDVTEKFFVRVDVTEAFPFLLTKISPYVDRR
jgi:PatG C-terminal